MLGIAIKQLVNVLSRIHIIFPKPALQSPGWSKWWISMSLGIERIAPKRIDEVEIGDYCQGKQADQECPEYLSYDMVFVFFQNLKFFLGDEMFWSGLKVIKHYTAMLRSIFFPYDY